MLSSMCLPACCRAATHTPGNKSAVTHPQTVSQEPVESTRSSTPPTFIEVQLFLLLLLLLLRLVVLGFGRHPLDFSRRLLPLAALVQGRFRSLADEVVSLCLGEDGGALPLQEELAFRRQMRISQTSREGGEVIISKWEGFPTASGRGFLQKKLPLA